MNKFYRYSILCLSKSKNITFEEAEKLFLLQQEEQKKIAKSLKKKKKIEADAREYNKIKRNHSHSVMTGLQGVTSSRNWKKTK